MGKEKKVKPIVYNTNDREIVAVLKENGPMTLAEISEKLGRHNPHEVIKNIKIKKNLIFI
jgi:DNA-binding Lrp family transcriptional regulator